MGKRLRGLMDILVSDRAHVLADISIPFVGPHRQDVAWNAILVGIHNEPCLYTPMLFWTD